MRLCKLASHHAESPRDQPQPRLFRQAPVHPCFSGLMSALSAPLVKSAGNVQCLQGLRPSWSAVLLPCRFSSMTGGPDSRAASSCPLRTHRSRPLAYIHTRNARLSATNKDCSRSKTVLVMSLSNLAASFDSSRLARFRYGLGVPQQLGEVPR